MPAYKISASAARKSSRVTDLLRRQFGRLNCFRSMTFVRTVTARTVKLLGWPRFHRAQEGAILQVVEISGLLVAKNAENAFEHLGRQMHMNVAATFEIVFERHARIREVNPSEITVCARQLDLGSHRRVPVRAAVEQDLVARHLRHDGAPCPLFHAILLISVPALSRPAGVW